MRLGGLGQLGAGSLLGQLISKRNGPQEGQETAAAASKRPKLALNGAIGLLNKQSDNGKLSGGIGAPLGPEAEGGGTQQQGAEGSMCTGGQQQQESQAHPVQDRSQGMPFLDKVHASTLQPGVCSTRSRGREHRASSRQGTGGAAADVCLLDSQRERRVLFGGSKHARPGREGEAAPQASAESLGSCRDSAQGEGSAASSRGCSDDEEVEGSEHAGSEADVEEGGSGSEADADEEKDEDWLPGSGSDDEEEEGGEAGRSAGGGQRQTEVTQGEQQDGSKPGSKRKRIWAVNKYSRARLPDAGFALRVSSRGRQACPHKPSEEAAAFAGAAAAAVVGGRRQGAPVLDAPALACGAPFLKPLDALGQSKRQRRISRRNDASMQGLDGGEQGPDRGEHTEGADKGSALHPGGANSLGGAEGQQRAGSDTEEGGGQGGAPDPPPVPLPFPLLTRRQLPQQHGSAAPGESQASAAAAAASAVLQDAGMVGVKEEPMEGVAAGVLAEITEALAQQQQQTLQEGSAGADADEGAGAAPAHVPAAAPAPKPLSRRAEREAQAALKAALQPPAEPALPWPDPPTAAEAAQVAAQYRGVYWGSPPHNSLLEGAPINSSGWMAAVDHGSSKLSMGPYREAMQAARAHDLLALYFLRPTPTATNFPAEQYSAEEVEAVRFAFYYDGVLLNVSLNRDKNRNTKPCWQALCMSYGARLALFRSRRKEDCIVFMDSLNVSLKGADRSFMHLPAHIYTRPLVKQQLEHISLIHKGMLIRAAQINGRSEEEANQLFAP